MTVPGLQAIGRDFPDFLEADRKLGRMRRVAELQGPHQLLRQVAAHAIGEDRDLGENVGARLVGRLLLAVTADARVAGPHADHPLPVEQHRLCRESREQVDARRCLRSESPASR